MAKVTIHGYKEFFLINFGVKIYKNDESTYIGKIGRESTTFVDVEEGDTLIFKSSFRKVSLAIDHNTTDILLQFDRFNGFLRATPANKENLLMVRQLIDKSASLANLRSFLLIFILLLIILLPLLLFS